jgi:hypothetical protein
MGRPSDAAAKQEQGKGRVGRQSARAREGREGEIDVGQGAGRLACGLAERDRRLVDGKPVEERGGARVAVEVNPASARIAWLAGILIAALISTMEAPRGKAGPRGSQSRVESCPSAVGPAPGF